MTTTLSIFCCYFIKANLRLKHVGINYYHMHTVHVYTSEVCMCAACVGVHVCLYTCGCAHLCQYMHVWIHMWCHVYVFFHVAALK